MLTPTGVTAAEYWAAIKAGHPTHVRMTFIGQNIVLGDQDIEYNSGITVTDILNGETDLIFGRAVSKQMTAGILNSSRLSGLKWTGEFTLEFGVDIGSPAVTNWVTIGYFSGEKPNNVTSANVIEFTAYDRMKMFDSIVDEYVKNITYPATVQDIYDGLCEYVGIDNVAGDELSAIMSRSYSEAPAEMQGYTCRDLLAWIAEACGCYAKITAAGKVQMVWYTDNTSYAITGDEEFHVESGDVNDGMTWDEADQLTWDEIDQLSWDDVCGYREMYSIDNLLVRQLNSDVAINYPYATNGNIYLISGNPFLSVSTYSDVTTYIAPIYNRMKTFGGYLPARVECIGNWCVESGDVITIAVNSSTVTFPIFVKEMRWNGAVRDSYEATGNKSRTLYQSDVEKQQVLMAKKIEMFVEEAADGIAEEVQGNVEAEMEQNYYKIRSGIQILPEGITVSGGKFIKIESGGVLDVSSSNFEINSLNELLRTGNWKFYNYGAKYTSANNVSYVITDQTSLSSDTKGGLFFIDSNSSGGSIILFTRQMDNSAFGELLLTCESNKVVSLIGVGTRYVRLGRKDAPFATAYLHRIYGRYYMSGGVDVGSQIYFELSQHVDDETDGLSSSNYWLEFSSVWSETSYDIHINARGSIKFDTSIKAGTIYYNTLSQSSSRDIKHNIAPLESVGEKLDRLEPVTFVYDEDEQEKQRMGLIYEDAVEVMPEICTDDESNKSINYVELIPALLKEIKDLRARVKYLEERIGE